MNQASKNILVTGGAGYIGSHCCKALSKAGYTPVAYDNLSRGFERLVSWGPFEYGDIGDRKRLAEVFNHYKPAAVIHFAAYAYIGESNSEPLTYYRNNVADTITLLEAVKAASIQHFVFSSSCAVYGVASALPLNEHVLCRPINTYGRCKLMVENILRDCDRDFGLKSLSLRYFNAAGADPDGETGELHDPEFHVIPLTLMAAANDIPCFNIFGDDYETPDGSAIRDFIHVTDLANAHVAGLRYILDGNDTNVMNLGSGTGYSVKEIIRTTESITGNVVPTQILPRRPGDPPELYADTELAKSTLGFTPEFSDITKIIRDAWSWYIAQSNSPAIKKTKQDHL